MASQKVLSTTALAKRNNLEAKVVFETFQQSGYLKKENGNWLLTAAGEALGGTYIEHPKYGKYVGWPEGTPVTTSSTEASTATAVVAEVPPAPPAPASTKPKQGTLTATRIGKHFELSANKCNYIFSELGWVKKGLKGWHLTDPGKRVGGVQSEDPRSGVPYVRWPEAILENRALVDTIAEVKGTSTPSAPDEVKDTSQPEAIGFRQKFEATHRAADGHFVRSRAEMLIDNWLYMAEIVHAYERKLPIEEDVYCDFYVPTGKVYIDFWGLENDPKYAARKAQKKAIYEKYGFNLIELNDADVLNLDDMLPRHLLKFGVQAY